MSYVSNWIPNRFGYEKNSKAQQKIKKGPKKIHGWFGPWTIDPICFYKDVVIIQRKLAI